MELSLSSENTYRSASECPAHLHVAQASVLVRYRLFPSVYQYPNRGLLFCAKEGKYAGNVTVLSKMCVILFSSCKF